MSRWETNGVFFAQIRLYRTLKSQNEPLGSPARTTKVRLWGRREIGGFLLNLLYYTIAKKKWARYNMDKKAKVTAMVWK